MKEILKNSAAPAAEKPAAVAVATTTAKPTGKKALALFSGGLDSMLACAVAARAGAAVEAIFIQTGFSAPDEALLRKRAAAAGADFSVVDIRDEYLQKVLFSPKYGYGKAINPCIDCHGFMFATALALLGARGADFVISGEVLGQRPMSQRAQALNSVKKLAGEGAELIVRPLSAQLLPPSLPEQLGWIDRSRLLGLSGRGRSAQMALAQEFGFSEYESPAGGCILTLAAFKTKVLDAREHGELASAAEAALLQCGRHLRLPGGAKMIISRDEGEGERLERLAAAVPWCERIWLGEGTFGAQSYLGAAGGAAAVSAADLALAVALAKAYARGYAAAARWADRICEEPVAPAGKAAAQSYMLR